MQKQNVTPITFDPIPPPPNPVAGAIVQQLGPLLQEAARAIQSMSSSTFSPHHPIQMAPSLLRQLHKFLPLFAQYPPPTDPDAPHMPPCFVCGTPPGSHWAHDCPHVDPEHTKYLVYDYRRKKILRYRDCTDYSAGPVSEAPSPFPPTCGICGKGPNLHWPDQCPQNPLREIMDGDRILSKEEQIRRTQTDQAQWPYETGLPREDDDHS